MFGVGSSLLGLAPWPSRSRRRPLTPGAACGPDWGGPEPSRARAVSSARPLWPCQTLAEHSGSPTPTHTHKLRVRTRGPALSISSYTAHRLVGCLQAPQAKKFLVQVLISGRLGAPLRSARKRLSHAAAAAGQPSWSACSPPGRRRSAPRACAAPRAAPAQGPSGCGPGGRPPRPGCGSLHRSGRGPAQGGLALPGR